MVTAPVAVFEHHARRPGSRLGHRGITPETPKVAACPSTVPFAATLAMGVAAVPATAVPLVVAGRMLALTLMVSSAVAQFAGEFLSQSW
jgi:hypothetical protein